VPYPYILLGKFKKRSINIIMGRQLRIEYPDALYHIMSHGNGFQ